MIVGVSDAIVFCWILRAAGAMLPSSSSSPWADGTKPSSAIRLFDVFVAGHILNQKNNAPYMIEFCQIVADEAVSNHRR